MICFIYGFLETIIQNKRLITPITAYINPIINIRFEKFKEITTIPILLKNVYAQLMRDEADMKDIEAIDIIEKVMRSDVKLSFFATTPSLPMDFRILPVLRTSIVSSIAILPNSDKIPIIVNTPKTPRQESKLSIMAPITGEIIGESIPID